MHVIRILGDAWGGPCDHTEQYVVFLDADAHGGRGALETTKDIAKAKKFVDAREAYTYYTTQSNENPTRADGRPNRPLTAYTVEIIPDPSEQKR